jgi:hypothetical protein
MKKFEKLGRVLSKKEQRDIAGGPGGGTCCAIICCYPCSYYESCACQATVCGWSNQPGMWLNLCHLNGHSWAISASNAGCGCEPCSV